MAQNNEETQPDNSMSAVSVTKCTTMGTRSLTERLPQFGLKSAAIGKAVEGSNLHGSMAVLMIKTARSVEEVEEIVAVKGVDVRSLALVLCPPRAAC